jgi:hypothetical protein
MRAQTLEHKKVMLTTVEPRLNLGIITSTQPPPGHDQLTCSPRSPDLCGTRRTSSSCSTYFSQPTLIPSPNTLVKKSPLYCLSINPPPYSSNPITLSPRINPSLIDGTFIPVGSSQGPMNTNLRLYLLPSDSYYTSARALILKSADCSQHRCTSFVYKVCRKNGTIARREALRGRPMVFLFGWAEPWR